MSKVKILVFVMKSNNKKFKNDGISLCCNETDAFEKSSEKELWDTVLENIEDKDSINIIEYDESAKLFVESINNHIVIKQEKADKPLCEVDNSFENIFILLSHYFFGVDIEDEQENIIQIFEKNYNDVPNYPYFQKNEDKQNNVYFSSFRSDDMYTDENSIICFIYNEGNKVTCENLFKLLLNQ